MIKILKIESGFLKNRVLIEAQNDCEEVFGSFFGDIVFYINKGERQWIKISKNDCVFAEGEVVDFSSVCNTNTARQFLWYYI